MKSKPVLAGLACSLVFAAALALYYGAGRGLSRATPTALPPTPTPACVASDRTFCPSEAKFIRYVETGDFSDILEEQTPVAVHCDSPGTYAAACPAGSSLVVQVFPVSDHGATAYLSRNEYIAYFNRFRAGSGPLKFTADVSAGGGIEMQFQGAKSGRLQLPFQNKDGDWRLGAPVVQ